MTSQCGALPIFSSVSRKSATFADLNHQRFIRKLGNQWYPCFSPTKLSCSSILDVHYDTNAPKNAIFSCHANTIYAPSNSNPPVLKLGGTSASPVPHSLGSIPNVISIVCLFKKKSCEIQFLLHYKINPKAKERWYRYPVDSDVLNEGISLPKIMCDDTRIRDSPLNFREIRRQDEIHRLSCNRYQSQHQPNHVRPQRS
jgi:hypothetical protein